MLSRMSVFRRTAGAESRPGGLYEEVATLAFEERRRALPEAGNDETDLAAEEATKALTAPAALATRWRRTGAAWFRTRPANDVLRGLVGGERVSGPCAA